MKRRAVADPVNLAYKKYSKFNMITNYEVDVSELVVAIYIPWTKKSFGLVVLTEYNHCCLHCNFFKHEHIVEKGMIILLSNLIIHLHQQLQLNVLDKVI